LLCAICFGQKEKSAQPDSVVIARHTFFDFGPPFDFYELIRVKGGGDTLSVERALITPHGLTCVLQPATVEYESKTLHKAMTDLLAGKNPCTIPERDLHRELKRCKKCLTFSGANVTMEASCGNTLRQLRMDVLDRDMFDSAPHTPENTSWTMGVLGELDKALGPGPMDKPMFAVADSVTLATPGTDLVREIRAGQYDALFGKEQAVSQIVLESEMSPPLPPSVAIESVMPPPVSPKIPNYPPIAKAAHVEGLVNVTFDIGIDGKVQNISVINGPKLAELGVIDAVSTWTFPETAWGRNGNAAIRFSLNCKAGLP